MTDQQFNKLLSVLTTQAVLMHGIMNLLQQRNMSSGAGAAGIQFKDFQKILDNAPHINVPG